MSTPGDNGSWNPQGDDFNAQQGAQDPYAQPQQDPWAQPPAEQPSAAQDAYGQQDPYGQQPPAAGQDPYGPDPYGQPPVNSASDPYAQGQQHWSPAPSSGHSASDPYARGGAPYGQPSAGQAPPATGGPAPAGEPQSRLVVGLLGIFLGGFGVHRFLMGYTTIGIIQAAITVLSCFTLYPAIQIWGLIEGIMVLAKSESFVRDAHGRPLKD